MILQLFWPALLAFGFFTQSAARTAQSSPQQAPAAQNLRVSGTVVDALTGQPLAQAQVFLTAQAVRDSEQFLMTGEDGHFAFENLAPGHYVLFANHKGYVQQLYKQHAQFSTAIIVGPELITENLRFELRPTSSISGQVLDERNEPIRNAQAILFHQMIRFGRHTTWREREVSTDDRGHYHFGYLAPGVYFVAVSAQPWYARRRTHQHIQTTDSSGQTTSQDITNEEPELDVVYPVTFYSHAEDLAEAVPITLHAGDAEVADFSIQPAPALHVLIHSATSSESEGLWAQVSQTLGNGSKMQVQTSTQQVAPGVFEIAGIPAGKLQLGLVSSKDGESNTRWNNVEIAGDMEISASDTAASANVSGVVKFDDNFKRASPIRLRLSSTAENQEYQMQADEHGDFTLRGSIPPGTYDLLLGQPAAAAIRGLSATGAKVSGHTLEIGPGQDVKLNVVLSKGTGKISGVARKNGKPMDGVMVVLVPEDPEHNIELFRRDQSDSDGSFNLPDIHTGKYTVVAIENGWELEWSVPAVIQKYLPGGQKVNVEADARIEVKVNVQP
jgi:protocatechuate 3,4-dioxygenase beta subunit